MSKKKSKKKKTKKLVSKLGNTLQKAHPKKVGRNKKGHKEENHIKSDLENIYRDTSGDIPEMDNIEFRPKNKLTVILTWLVIIFGITAFIAWLGYFSFNRSNQFNNQSIRMEIKGPFTATTGDEISYDVHIINEASIDLTQSHLEVQLPTAFTLIRTTKESITSDSGNDISLIKAPRVLAWDLGTIPKNSSENIKLIGVLIEEVGTNHTITARLSYTPSNFSSEFQKRGEFSTEITNSPVAIDLDFPSEVYANQESEYSLTLSNTLSATIVENLMFEILPPFNFQFTKLGITQEGKEDIEHEDDLPKELLFDNILPDQPIIIIFRGIMQLDEDDSIESTFDYKLSLKTDKEYKLTNKGSEAVVVATGDVLVNLIINGETSNSAINWGESLDVLINIQNKTESTAQRLSLRAVFDSPYLDFSTLEDELDGVSDDRQITWNESQGTIFKGLLPGEELDVKFKIDVDEFKALNPVVPNATFTIKSFAELTVGAFDGTDINQVYASEVITSSINTNASVISYARYFDPDGESIGSGPLPPVEGEKTSYIVFWEIHNSLHDLQSITLKADLPDGVQWKSDSQVTTGNIFLSNSNEVVWETARLPSTIPEAIASFSISITPTSADVDKILTLLTQSSLTATDKVTGDILSYTAPALTTNLDQDPQAEGKGLVQSK